MPLPSIHTRAAMAATITRCSLATIKLLPRHNPIMVRRIMSTAAYTGALQTGANWLISARFRDGTYVRTDAADGTRLELLRNR